MDTTTTVHYCKTCKKNGKGNFCNHCGQDYLTKRITISSVVHEIFHFFSHLDKGFLYTLKNLIIAPGKPQLEYINGDRTKHQKPFSMFFLCATAAALIYYWTNSTLFKYYKVGEANDAQFFHQYMVILTIAMIPIYSLIVYCFFIKSKFNYAEVFILLLYNLSVVLLFSTLIQSLKFIFPEMHTEFVELPMIVLYNWLTNRFFFQTEKKWVIFLKTILSSALCFLLAVLVQTKIIDLIF